MDRTGRPALAEFTVKAVVTGIVLGLVFGAANAYLGLKVGMTVAASIPASVMAVAVFKLIRRPGTILEANLAQTIGSASTSLAAGTIFTIPALYMWGMAPPYWQVAILCLLGGVLGLAAMIPLRRLLIVDAHAELPYPEGTACAEVLRATAAGSSRSAWIFRGLAVGAAVKLLIGVFLLVPSELSSAVPILPKAEVALEITAALIGVGFILGYRQSAVIVAGSIVSAFALTPLIAWIGSSLTAPLYPEARLLVSEMSSGQIWSRYVRYIGAGAVATAGILTVLKSAPTMAAAFGAVVKGLRARRGVGGAAASAVPDTDRDLPGSFVVGAIVLVIAVAALVPGVFAGEMPPLQRSVLAAGVGIFGVLFVAVAARIVGIVGVSSQPTSGITLVTLLGVASIFAGMGWDGAGAKAAVLTVGTIVAVAASKAGDISQDLKTGYLVGATPARQQLGQLIGAAFACWAVAATVMLLGSAYEFGSKALGAPQATLMKTIIEGVLAGNLPWGLVLTGAGISISAMLCGVSGLAFAIGVYLPLASMLPIFVGGCMRAVVERGRKAADATSEREEQSGDPGILAASGLVAGEGLAGIAVAGLVAAGLISRDAEPLLHGAAGTALGLALVAGICGFLVHAGRSARKN